MSEITIEVQQRGAKGKNASRRLRAAGFIPAVVYGGGREPVPIQVQRKTIHDLLKQQGGEHAIFLLKLAGTDQSRHTMVRDLEIDPISRQILHIDFQRILLTEKVRVRVAVELEGIPTGVKNQGGVLDFVTREIEISCLPADIPPKVVLDVAALEIGDHLEAKQVLLPPEVELLEEAERVIVSVAHSRVSDVVEAAEVEGEEIGLIEAEEEEPEVIGRGREKEEAIEEAD